MARRVVSVAPSATLAIAAKAKELQSQGIRVLSLSAGEPDFDTPDFVKDAAIYALQKGQTKYTPVNGTVELRKAICEKLQRDQNLTYTPEQIIVGTGAKHAIFNVFFALLNEGDEVLIPSPFWLSYPEMVSVLGGTPVFIHTDEKNDFKMTAEALEKAITPKSKVLILNSPSNPTGAVYSKEEFEKLIQVLQKHPNLLVLSDEIYEKLIFDDRKFYSIASLDPEIAKRTIVVNGHSKAYSMTGWRLGYAACPNKELANAVGSIQSHSTSNSTSFAQAGGIVALEKGDEFAAMMRDVYQKRRDFLFDKISAIKGLKPFKAHGAFYLFVNISETGLGSMEFAKRLLEEAHVAVIPGKPFGSDRHIRLSFATTEGVLTEASERIAQWLSRK